MASQPIAITREQWLNKAVVLFKPIFKKAGFPLPEKVRVSCGWPAAARKSRGKTTIGQCWSPEASGDKTTEMFISPLIDKVELVMSTTMHELVHAAVGTKCGHRHQFIACAKAIGFMKPWTQTPESPALKAVIADLLKKMPPYPHSRLTPSRSGIKKQSTRMLKAECDTCGYTVRLSKKWLVEVGAPHCPAHGEMSCDEMGDEE